MTARMYAGQMVGQEGHGAERTVYEACRKLLDDEDSVFYSVPRVAVDAQLPRHDGGADVVLAHPPLGIFVREVQGGRVGFDYMAGQWYSRSGDGQVHSIKDPFIQGVEAAHDLEKKLVPDLKPANRYLRVGHAATLPHLAGRATAAWSGQAV
jgi:hypothetical protein